MVDDEAIGKKMELYKAYFRILPQDAEALTLLREVAEQEADTFMDFFYKHILAFSENRRLFPDADTIARAREEQRKSFLSRFQGVWDEEYFRSRLNSGSLHDRIGVEPWQYCGGIALYITEMLPYFQRVMRRLPPAQQERILVAWVKMVLLDIALVWESFYHTREKRLQARLQELQALNHFTAQRMNELIEAKTSLEEQSKQLEVCLRIGGLVLETSHPQEAAYTMLDGLVTAMEVESGELWVVYEGEGRVVMVAHHGLFPTEFRKTTAFRLGEGFPGLAVATGEPIVTQEVARDPRFARQELVEVGLQFFASLPLKAKGRVVGVVSIASRHKVPWDEGKEKLAIALGSLLGRSTLKALLDVQRKKGETFS